MVGGEAQKRNQTRARAVVRAANTGGSGRPVLSRSYSTPLTIHLDKILYLQPNMGLECSCNDSLVAIPIHYQTAFVLCELVRRPNPSWPTPGRFRP